MPRPPRNKFNALPTTAPAAAGKALSAVPARVSSPRSTHTLSTSDDSDGLVTKNSTGANRRGIPRKDVFMGGALLEKPAEPRPRPLHAAERATLAMIARQADYEEKIAALKKRKEEAEAHAREQPKVLVPTSQEPPVSQRSNTAASRSPATETRTRSRAAQAAPSTVEKPKQAAGAHRRAQATPSSVLSLAKFKRRPRESSILRLAPEDESLSLTSLGGGSEDTFGDLENVKPLHESTPLNRPRGHQAVAPVATEQDEAARSTPTNPSSTSSRKRKITPPEVLVSHSQSPTSTPQPPAAEEDAIEPEILGEENDQDEPRLPSPKRRAIQPPEIWDEAMAPPQSSSPVRTQDPPADSQPQESPVKPRAARRVPEKQRSRAAKAAQASTVTRPNKKKAGQAKPMTTSALQNLLPRRRVTHPARDEFDFESSDVDLRPSSLIDEDADELSLLPSKKKRPATKASTAQKSKSKPAKPDALKTPRTRQPAKTLRPTGQGKAAQPKTYARRASDKENAAPRARAATAACDTSSLARGADAATGASTLDSSSILDVPEKGRTVLRGLARKFREIDRWEMTFEEVTASSSSPRDAR